MIRAEICQFVNMGSFPASRDVEQAVISRQEKLLLRIVPPVNDDEAWELIKLFGPDDYFGAAWTVLHLVESSPNWPLVDSLSNTSNEWIARLRDRAARKDLAASKKS